MVYSFGMRSFSVLEGRQRPEGIPLPVGLRLFWPSVNHWKSDMFFWTEPAGLPCQKKKNVVG